MTVDVTEGSGGSRSRRVALGLAALSFLAALVAAIGPADEKRSTYSWPPERLPQSSPTRLWTAPLLLVRHRPESLTATIPCSLPAALPDARRPVVVLATTRGRTETRGLVITRVGSRVRLEVDGNLLTTVAPADEPGGPGCTYRLDFEGGRWLLDSRTAERTQGDLGRAPVVNGFYSGLDLHTTPRPSIAVTTEVHRVSPTTRQELAWLGAVAALLAALALVAAPRVRRATVRAAARSARARLHFVDAVVVPTLVVWWVIAPVVWDDGWIVARERTYATSGGFSTYYSVFGVNLPLDFWVEWLHHWIADSSSVLVLRLPTLVCLILTWILCRWIVETVHPASKRASPVLWTLAAGFLVGALAWGMTLRPEFVTALTATAMLACAVRFAQFERVGPVAVAALLLPLALTAHTTGGVALAPLLAVSPQLVRWTRRYADIAAVVAVCSASFLVVLYSAGSDLAHRVDDARTTSEHGITSSWRAELDRYRLLDDFPWAAPIRYASVVFIVLALALFVLRRRSRKSVMDVPAVSLALGTVLLLLTSSKIPWHFGALTGLAATALAVECGRLRSEAHRVRAVWRPLALIAFATVGASLYWRLQGSWNPVDLRTVGWDVGSSAVSFRGLAVALPLLALVAFAAKRSGGSVLAAPWGVVAWLVPLLAAPLVVFTMGVLVVDAAQTDGWTFARQNLGAVAGRAGCGLGTDVDVALWGSARPLGVLPAQGPAASPTDEEIEPPVPGVQVFELGAGGAAGTGWFELPRRPERLALFAAGDEESLAALEVVWMTERRQSAEPLGAGRAPGLPLTVETAPWRMVLLTPPPGADRARVTLGRGTEQAVLITAPVTFRTETLGRRVAAPARTLVHPNLVLYFPCVKQPVLKGGAVEVPDYMIWFDHWYQPYPNEESSPFLGVRDSFDVRRLTLDGPNAPERVVVFEVVLDEAGVAVALPEVTATA